MANVGQGAVRLLDSDGDSLDDGAGRLNVNVDTTPATFNTIASVKVDTADDTSWHRLPNNAGNEVLIQSLSSNVDTIYLGKYVDESSEVESIELLPSTTVSMAISNTKLVPNKKEVNKKQNKNLE